MEALSPTRARWLRVLRVAQLAVLVGILAAILGERARPWVRDQAVSAIDDALGGKLTIAELDSVSLFGLRARGVRLRDQHGELVASVERVYAVVEPFALLGGTVRVQEIVLYDAYVDLGEPAEQRGGLLGLLASMPEPEADEEAEDEGDALALRFERITLHRARSRAWVDGAEYWARRVEAVARVHVGQQVAVDLARFGTELERDGKPLARVAHAKGRYDPSLDASPTAVVTRLRLGPERGAEPRTLRTWVDAREVTRDTFARAGLEVQELGAPFDVQATAVGTTERVHAEVGVQTPGAKLELSAHAGHDGSLEAYAHASAEALSQVPAVQALVTGLRGKLDLELRASRSAAGAYSGRTALQLDDAAYETAGLRALQLDARAQGHGVEPPAVELELHASELAAGRAQLHQVRLAVRGDQKGYAARGTLDTGRVEARARPDGDDCWEASGALDVPIDGDVLAARLERLRVQPERRLAALRALTLAYRDAHARIDGRLLERERVALQVRVHVPKLSSVTSPFVDTPVKGAADLTLDAQGPLQKPHVKLAAGYRTDELAGARRVALRLDVDADLPARKIVAQTRVRADGIDVELDANAELPRGALDAAHLERARAELELRIGRLALHQLSQWPELQLVPSRAVISGTARAEGTLESFELVTDLAAQAQFARDEAPIVAKLHGGLGKDGVKLALEAEDRRGPLVRSEVSFDLGSRRPSLDLASMQRVLMQRTWKVALWLGARRSDELPLTRALAVPEGLWPARVSASVELAHEPGQEPRGKAQAHAAWDPPGKSSLAPRCGTALRPKLAFSAKMQEGRLSTELRAGSEDRTTLVASSKSHAPMDEWLRVKPMQVRPVQIYATLDQLRLAQIPVVCEQASGMVSGKATLERGLTRAVTLDLDLTGQQLRFADSPPVEVRVAARAKDQRIVGSATFRAAGGTAEAAAELPLDRGGYVPSLAMNEPAQASLRLQKMPGSALIGAVPGMRSSHGTLQGSLSMKGTLAAPKVDGRLAMHDLTLTLGELGQRFERMNGQLVLHDRTLTLERISFHDLDGRATASGRMHWRSFEPVSFKGDFDLEATDLPIRRSGVMAARLDGKVGVKVDASPKRIDVYGSLRKGRIELTTNDVAAVQSLDPNPEIAFTDEPEETPAVEAKTATEVRIRIDAREPFWVRREDFSALVTARLTIAAIPDPPSITGTIGVQRGVVELLGQMFDIERGTIRFTGGSEVEPELDLVASRRAPGGNGEKVTISAKGSVHEPELSFEIDGKAVTAGEALAAALGTRTAPTGDQRVQDQMGSIATGIAGSVLTLGARRELGEWVPVLGFEQGGGETRIRAGVEADRLIPKFLRKVVVDAYVEGIVSSREQTDEGQVTQEAATGAAVLLELRFPHSLLSEAQYGPGPRWSLDLSWEP